MNKKLFISALFIVLLSITMINAQLENVVLSLTLKYDNGKIMHEETKLISGSPPDRINQPINGYTAKILSFKNELLYSFKFPIELIPLSALDPSWFDDEGNQIFFPNETVESLKKLTFILNFPFFNNAKYIEIYSPEDSLILTVDISKFALCNQNKICDSDESKELCPDDCSNVDVSYEKISFWQRIINWIKSLFS
ncbi:hypothetical protein HYT57_01115 [Candidatus Woesearchaeota archaeon]|nr:hypothetical protein [Candidatus Woesearchaeota archaeon]